MKEDLENKPTLKYKHYTYKGGVYRVIEILRAKCFIYNNWHWAVMYESADESLPYFVRSYIGFTAKFDGIPF